MISIRGGNSTHENTGTNSLNATSAKIRSSGQPEVMNRWLVVVGAIAIQLALGAIYAWSAFTKALQSEAFGFSKTQTQTIFSAGLASFGIVMILAGRLLQRYQPRYIAMAGGVLLGLGYILGGTVGDSFWIKLLTIGIIGGSGIGLAYVVPIAVGVQWFPDKKGLLTGLAVAGFGFGAFLWILMANPPSMLADSGLIDIGTDPSTGVEIYDADNINHVLVIYGVIFLILVVAGSIAMVSPPPGWLPAGYTPPDPIQVAGSMSERKVDLGSREMLTTWQFWALWTMFVFGALAGLMVIGNIKNFAQDTSDGFEGYGFSAGRAADYAVIGAAVFLPIFNGAGRIIWGSISDRIGRQPAFTMMFSFQFLCMLAFFFTTHNPYSFYLVAALIGFNFGGNFALFPAATADYFGTRNVGPNYGLMFTSYAAGGLIGPILAGLIKDGGYSYAYAFYPAAFLCLVAALLSRVLKMPGLETESDMTRPGISSFIHKLRSPRPTRVAKPGS